MPAAKLKVTYLKSPKATLKLVIFDLGQGPGYSICCGFWLGELELSSSCQVSMGTGRLEWRPDLDLKGEWMNFIFLVALNVFSLSVWADFDSSHNYTLNFEFDPRSGGYRPAYTYKTSKGDSTIWLDGANRRGKGGKGVKTATKSAGKSGSYSGVSAASANADEALLFVQFTAPKGWDIDRNADRVQIKNSSGTKFTIFASRESWKGDGYGDLIREWRNHVVKGMPLPKREEVQTVPMNGGGKCLVGAVGSGKGVALAIAEIEGRALTMMFEFSSMNEFAGERASYRGFLDSIAIKRGRMTAAK